VSVPGIAADHGSTVQLVDLVREEWNDPEWYSTWQGSKFGLKNLSIFLRGTWLFSLKTFWSWHFCT